jgi:hypothetical protein
MFCHGSSLSYGVAGKQRGEGQQFEQNKNSSNGRTGEFLAREVAAND